MDDMEGQAPSPHCCSCRGPGPDTERGNPLWVVMSKAAVPFVTVEDGVHVNVVCTVQPLLELNEKAEETAEAIERRAALKETTTAPRIVRPPTNLHDAGAEPSNVGLSNGGSGKLMGAQIGAEGPQRVSGPIPPLPDSLCAENGRAGVSAVALSERASLQRTGDKEAYAAARSLMQLCTAGSDANAEEEPVVGTPDEADKGGLSQARGPGLRENTEVLAAADVPLDMDGVGRKEVEATHHGLDRLLYQATAAVIKRRAKQLRILLRRNDPERSGRVSVDAIWQGLSAALQFNLTDDQLWRILTIAKQTDAESGVDYEALMSFFDDFEAGSSQATEAPAPSSAPTEEPVQAQLCAAALAHGIVGQVPLDRIAGGEKEKIMQIRAAAATVEKPPTQRVQPALPLDPPGLTVAADAGETEGQQVPEEGEMETPSGRDRHKILRVEIGKRALIGAFDSVGELDEVPETPSQEYAPLPSDAQRPEAFEDMDGCASVRSKERKDELEGPGGLPARDGAANLGQGFNTDLSAEGNARSNELPSNTRAEAAPSADVTETPRATGPVGNTWSDTIPNRSPPGSSLRLSGQEWGALHRPLPEEYRAPGVPSAGVTRGLGLPHNTCAGVVAHPKAPDTLELPPRKQTGLWSAAPLLGSPSASMEWETRGYGGLPSDSLGRGYPSSQAEDVEIWFVAETPQSEGYVGRQQKRRRAGPLEEDGGKRAKKSEHSGGLQSGKEWEPLVAAVVEKGVAGLYRGLDGGCCEGLGGKGLDRLTSGTVLGEDPLAVPREGKLLQGFANGGFLKKGPLDPALDAQRGVAAESKGLGTRSKDGFEPFRMGLGLAKDTGSLRSGLLDPGRRSNWLEVDETSPGLLTQKEPLAGGLPRSGPLEAVKTGPTDWAAFCTASREQRASFAFNIVGLVNKIGGWALYLIAGARGAEGQLDGRPIHNGSRRELMEVRANLDVQSKAVCKLRPLDVLTEEELRGKAWKTSQEGRVYVVRRLVGEKLTLTDLETMEFACSMPSPSQPGDTEWSAQNEGGSQLPSGCPDRSLDMVEDRAEEEDGVVEVFHDVPADGRPQRQIFSRWSLVEVVSFMTRVDKWQHDPLCSICQEDVVFVATLCQAEQCGHVFHRQCLLSWFKRSNSCPTCRARIPVFEGKAIEQRNIQPSYDEDVEHNPFDDVMCETCGLDEAEEDAGNPIIICDNCDHGYHIACIELTGVPEGDWDCFPCQAARANQHEPRLASQNQQRHTHQQRQSRRAARRQRGPGGRAAGRAVGNGTNRRGSLDSGLGQVGGPFMQRATLEARPDSQLSPDLGRDGFHSPRQSPRTAERRLREGSLGSASPLMGAALFGPETSGPDSSLVAGLRSSKSDASGLEGMRRGRSETERGAQGVSWARDGLATGFQDAVGCRSYEEEVQQARRRGASPGAGPEQQIAENGRGRGLGRADGDGGEGVRLKDVGADVGNGDYASPEPDAEESASEEEQAASPAGHGNKRQKRVKRPAKLRDPSGPKPCASCKGNKKGGGYCLSKGHQRPR